MTLQALSVRTAAAAAFVLAFSVLAEAQATRTWVSGVGDDINPCSRTAPCKTFAGAIIKTATNGYINVIDPGSYGAVTITKSITIDGGGFQPGIVADGTNGIVVNSASAKVVLRNLALYGKATGVNGIHVINVASLHVENVSIMHFINHAINFNPGGAGGALYVDNVITRATHSLVVNNGRASINHLRAEGNVKGLLAGANALVSVRDSVIIGNGEGLAATAASTVVIVDNTKLIHNTFGISASGGSTFRISDCEVVSNTNTGLFNDGASFIVSLQGNSVAGNPVAGSFTSTVIKQ